MEKRPPLKDGSYSADQEITCFYGICVRTSPSLDPVASELNPPNILTIHFPKMDLITVPIDVLSLPSNGLFLNFSSC
jgi:hypothetical protein